MNRQTYLKKAPMLIPKPTVIRIEYAVNGNLEKTTFRCLLILSEKLYRVVPIYKLCRMGPDAQVGYQVKKFSLIIEFSILFDKSPR